MRHRTAVLIGAVLAVAAIPTVHAGEIAVAGRAVTTGGTPLAEASVALSRVLEPVAQARFDLEGRLPDPVARGRTDTNGYFELVAPGAGLYRVRVEAAGFVPVEYGLEPLLEPVELEDARLGPDAGVTVRVLARDGKPLTGATVRLMTPRSRFGPGRKAAWEPAARTATTSGEGSARFARADGEPVVVTATAPGFLLQERRNFRGTSTTLTLERGIERTIEVRAADGTALAGVLATTGETDHPLGLTDASGTLRVAVPPRGSLKLSLRASDGRESEGTISPPSKTKPSPRPFVLEPLGSLAGRVIDAETRRPIENAWVFRSGAPWGAVPTDASGAFALAGTRGRSLEVTAGATGYLASRIEGSDLPGPTVALRPAAAIEGTVVDPAGDPVAGAKLRLETKRPGGDVVIVRMGAPQEGPSTTSSSRGRFRLSGIDPGHAYDLETRAPGFAPASKEVLDLERGKTLKGVRIELDRGQALIGRITDADGRPLRDAEASLRASPRGRGAMMVLGEDAAAEESARSLTNDDGRFEIGGLRPGTFDLTLRRKGFARKSVAGIEVRPGMEPLDLGELVMEPGAVVQGRVSDPGGQPIEGVEVSIVEGQAGPMFLVGGGPSRERSPDAATGPDGWFTVEDLRRGEPLQLSFSRRGYLAAREAGVSVPTHDPLLVVLEPASRVSGIVVDPDKKPLPQARVSLSRTQSGGIGGNVFRMMRREDATADDAGRFLFENVEPGTISLSASASGWQETKIDALEVPKGADLENVELPLSPGAIITGRVTAPDGRPAIGAGVRVVRQEDEPFRFGGPVADGDGRFRIEGVEPGRVSVEATHEDYLRAVKDLEARPGTNVLNLQLEGGNEVSGTVVDTAGTPLSGATVRLSSKGDDWGGPDTLAGPDGSFRLSGVGDGDYTLRASRSGYAPSAGGVAVHVEGQPVRDLRIELAPGGSVVGKVAGLDPEKLPQVVIRAFGPGDGFPVATSPNREGDYRLEDLGPGSWNVVASLQASGEQAKGQAILEPGAVEARCDLQFGGGLTLSGRAVHGDALVKEAAVLAVGTDVDHSVWGRTGPTGTFALKGLLPGTYRVDLRQWETGLSHSETVEVKADREIVLQIPTARIVGVAVDTSDRRPLAGVTVTLAPPAGGTGRAPSFMTDRGATTDSNGRFEVSNLEDGEWRLTAAKKGYAARTMPVNVQHGRGPSDLKVDLDPTAGLTLEVRLPSGRTPDEVSIAVVDPSGRAVTRGSFATGENGIVRLSSVPPGTWEVLAMAGGSGTAIVRASAPGAPVPVVLPPACALKISVPDLEGGSVPATATIRGADGTPYRTLAWFSDPVSDWRLRGGELVLDTLPPGSWMVQVGAADGRSWQGNASTAPGSQASLVLR